MASTTFWTNRTGCDSFHRLVFGMRSGLAFFLSFLTATLDTNLELRTKVNMFVQLAFIFMSSLYMFGGRAERITTLKPNPEGTLPLFIVPGVCLQCMKKACCELSVRRYFMLKICDCLSEDAGTRLACHFRKFARRRSESAPTRPAGGSAGEAPFPRPR